MLLTLSFKNWASFKDKATISAIADRQRTHRERIARIDKYGERVIPIIAIYGGNASGKSNILEALRFLQDFVTNGTKTDEKIDIEPFALSDEMKKSPVEFCLEILVNGKIYEFSFVASRESVIYVCS